MLYKFVLRFVFIPNFMTNYMQNYDLLQFETGLGHCYELFSRKIDNASLFYQRKLFFILTYHIFSLLPVNCGKEMEVAFVCLFDTDVGNCVAIDNLF